MTKIYRAPDIEFSILLSEEEVSYPKRTICVLKGVEAKKIRKGVVLVE